MSEDSPQGLHHTVETVDEEHPTRPSFMAVFGEYLCRLLGHKFNHGGWCISCGRHISADTDCWPSSDTCLVCGSSVKHGLVCSTECSGEWIGYWEERANEFE